MGLSDNEPSIDLDRLTAALKEMEADIGLLDDDSFGRSGRLAWEAARFSVHSALKEQFLGYGEAHAATASLGTLKVSGTVRLSWTVLKNAIIRGFLWAPRGKEFLIWANPRRKETPGGIYEDPFTDELAAELGRRRATILERPIRRGHAGPTPFRVWFADLRDIIAVILRLFVPSRLPKAVARMAQQVEAYLQAALGQDISIEPIVQRAYYSLIRSRIASRWMLRWLRPGAILMVCSYGQEGLVLAAKDLSIPTVEIQHGVITQHHLGYSFPGESEKLSFPDYLWLFGDFWRDINDFPIREKNLAVLGYPYFDRLRKGLKVTAQKQIVFVSQGTIGRELSLFAVKNAAFLTQEWKIVYKLHPGEVANWTKRYPWLLEASKAGAVTVLEGDSPSLYELFAASQWQVGVYSTAIFEGLALGCKAILLNLPGIEYMEPLVEAGFVRVLHPRGTLDLSPHYQLPEADYIFAPDWRERFHTLIEGVARV